MKIFFSTNDLWNLENFRKPLLLELNKKHELVILTNLKKKKLVNKKTGLKIYHVNFKSNFNLINDLVNLIVIFFLTLKHKPDIYLNFTIKPILLCSFVSKLLKIKSINTVTGLGNLYLGSKLFRIFYIFFYKFFTSKKNYFFFHNKNDLKFFLKKNISEKLKSYTTKGSGINLTDFKNLNPTLKQKKKFLMVSRLIYNKGAIEFFKAADLLKNNNNLMFEFLGREKNDKFNEIKNYELKKYKSNKNLKISYFNSNIKKKLQDANFVVLPSYREGMSKSLMEALASGIPVIASKVEGNSELVKNNYNGFFFRAKDYKSLIRCILKSSKLNKKNYKKISRNCRKFAENYLNEKKVVLKYSSLIKNIK